MRGSCEHGNSYVGSCMCVWELCGGTVGTVAQLYGELCGGDVCKELYMGEAVFHLCLVSDPFMEIFNMLLCGMFQWMCCRG